MRILAITLFLAVSGFASDRSLLNGVWTLEPLKTDFAGQPAVQTGTVTINEREGNITVSRKFVYKSDDHTYFYSDSADSENGASIRRGEVKSKAKWDHAVLRVTTTEEGVTTKESYSLAPDGSMTVLVEREGHPAVSLIYRRK